MPSLLMLIVSLALLMTSVPPQSAFTQPLPPTQTMIASDYCISSLFSLHSCTIFISFLRRISTTKNRSLVILISHFTTPSIQRTITKLLLGLYSLSSSLHPFFPLSFFNTRFVSSSTHPFSFITSLSLRFILSLSYSSFIPSLLLFLFFFSSFSLSLSSLFFFIS